MLRVSQKRFWFIFPTRFLWELISKNVNENENDDVDDDGLFSAQPEFCLSRAAGWGESSEWLSAIPAIDCSRVAVNFISLRLIMLKIFEMNLSTCWRSQENFTFLFVWRESIDLSKPLQSVTWAIWKHFRTLHKNNFNDFNWFRYYFISNWRFKGNYSREKH